MQLSLPSRRRVARFLVAFYGAMTLLFAGFFAVLGIFGPFSLMNVWASAHWPTMLIVHEIHAALLLVGLLIALVEPRLTGVGR